MIIPNIFKNRTGAIQLADLDDNFNTVSTSVNAIDTQISILQTAVQDLNNQIANFSAVPIGCIVVWSGSLSNIPNKWRLCDGTNNTPDLRDKFIIGARQDNLGVPATTVTGSNTSTGGQKDTPLVSHTHNATTSATANTRNHSFSADIRVTNAELFAVQGDATQISGSNTNVVDGAGGFGGSEFTSNFTRVRISDSYDHDHTISATTTLDSTGGSGSNANLPPYFALAYIMKVE